MELVWWQLEEEINLCTAAENIQTTSKTQNIGALVIKKIIRTNLDKAFQKKISKQRCMAN
jgi:hypothetical protein